MIFELFNIPIWEWAQYFVYMFTVSISELDTIVGARSTDDLITQRRKYNFSDKIVWKEKTHAPFLTIMNRRLAKYSVTDPEPKIMQDGYTQIIFTLNNAAGTTTAFELTDNEAALIQADDFFGVLNANGYVTELMEICHVQSVGANGSGPAGAGYTLITVERAYMTTGTSGSSGATGHDISTASQWRIVHLGTTYSEGSGIGESKNVEVETLQVYTEIMKEAYEVTGTFNATDYYGPVDMQYKARKARKDFFRKFEYKLLLGRKGKKTIAGKPKRAMGGVHEFIYSAETDGTHFLDFGNSATPTTWNTKSETIFTFGSESKFVFAGPGLMTLVDNAFTGSAHVYTKNEQLSKQYLIKVMTLSLSHGDLHFVREQALADLPIYTKTAFVLDLEFFNYMYLKGRDVQILKNVQVNDKDTEKNAIFAEIGLHRSFAESNYWVYNLD